MDRRSPTVGQLLIAMTVFLVAGAPIAYFMWHELSTLLYGRVADVRWPLLLGAVLGFAVLLWALAQFVHRATGNESEETT